ncbi:MAG TPA: carboxypeptidase regulatory-like domain-containing protein, partial [Vicinamibacterales bacterium]|nr:carboxypeptidase regulatory-like domain-containing protein [Vicinamibacterales bacterium]
MRATFVLLVIGFSGVIGVSGVAQGAQQAQRPGQPATPVQPPRDTSAQNKETAPAPTGSILGRVVAADTGRPIKRARVMATASELPGGRGMLTDDKGTFELTEMPAGRYTVNVSKSGFVALSYGQRRPLQPGTPLQLADGQQLKGVDFSLPRGSVIAGQVLDEDGEPMPGVNVRVMRYQFQQGERRLSQAGTGQTDDRGQFRVWGLMPGEYYVNALARNNNFGGRGAGQFLPAGPPGGRGGRGAAPVAAAAVAGSGDDEDSLAYAPTYYPGVAAIEEAKSVTVGLSQEVVAINFNLLLVRTARISGRVTNPDGSVVSNGNINLATDAGRGQMGQNFGGRIGRDGAFSIANVPPGRYILRARSGNPGNGNGGDNNAPPLYGSAPVSVNGQDLESVTVQLAVGATLTGTIVFPPGGASLPDPTQVRVMAPPIDPDTLGGPQPNGRVDKDARFTLQGVPAGEHLIRANGNTRGWTLRSVTIGGRDVTDTPIAVRSGQAIGDIVITFTDKVTEINGTLSNGQNAPASDYTVLAFPTDATMWRAQSRQIQTTRPDQTGQFRIRGLPPGDYFLVAVDPAEQGEWFDPTYL